MFPTPNKAQTMKTDRPAGVLGVKSPYPTVLNASKPKREHEVYQPRQDVEHVQVLCRRPGGPGPRSRE